MKCASDSFQGEAQPRCPFYVPVPLFGGDSKGRIGDHGFARVDCLVGRDRPGLSERWRLDLDRPVRPWIRRLSRRISLAAQVDSSSPRERMARWTSGSAPATSAAAEIESLPESIASTSSGIPIFRAC